MRAPFPPVPWPQEHIPEIILLCEACLDLSWGGEPGILVEADQVTVTVPAPQGLAPGGGGVVLYPLNPLNLSMGSANQGAPQSSKGCWPPEGLKEVAWFWAGPAEGSSWRKLWLGGPWGPCGPFVSKPSPMSWVHLPQPSQPG